MWRLDETRRGFSQFQDPRCEQPASPDSTDRSMRVCQIYRPNTVGWSVLVCVMRLGLASGSRIGMPGTPLGFVPSIKPQARHVSAADLKISGPRSWPFSARARPSFPIMLAKGGGVKERSALYIEVEEVSDAWRMSPAIDILRQGGMGIVPTDACYSFVTDVKSRKGVERLYQVMGAEPKVKKPLALLCHSISQISEYTTATNFKSVFKMLKALLPGPYTFIFPATNELPRMIIEHKKHTWKRKEIGVRVPDDPLLLELLQSLDSPLLVTGVPREGGGDQPFDPALSLDRWEKQVDFVIANGLRQSGQSTTVVDMTKEPPELLREGVGSWKNVQEYLAA